MDENKKMDPFEEMTVQKEPELILPGEETGGSPELQTESMQAAEDVPSEPAAEDAAIPVEEPVPAPDDAPAAAPDSEPDPWQQIAPEIRERSEPEAPEPVVEETGPLSGGVRELREIKEAINDLARAEQECKDTEKYLKGKTKELEIQKKRVEEKIEAAVKKARTDLEKGYDSEIAGAEKAIKEAEQRKKTAKAAAVNERMKRENSSLVDDNKVLQAEIKSRFKDAGVPSLCRRPLYYSLFAPKKLSDYLICILAILIFAGVIPFCVTQLVNGTLFKVLVWVLIVVFFAAIYFLIAFWTRKGSRNEALHDMRSKVNQIRDNNKTIKNRNKNIRMDPDESQYNLYQYDQELEAARSDLEKARRDRQQALEQFDRAESVRIREDLEREKAPVFEQMEKEIAVMKEDYQQKEENRLQAQRVVDGYNASLGDKGWKPEKIDELISIMEEGKASTIREAMNVQKSK